MEGALNEYGVIIDRDDYTVDTEATRELRLGLLESRVDSPVPDICWGDS